jgi:hypothetical protein
MAFFVVFIHGPAAAGKHTIGSLVSDQLGLPLFHNHLTVDLVKTFFEFGTPDFIELRADIWKSSFRAAADAGRSFVFTFNPEATVAPSLMDELSDIVTNAGGQIHYVELHCSDSEIERRIGNPSRQQFGKLTDPEVYRDIKSQGGFKFPTFPKPLVSIDTETVTPDEGAHLIVRSLKQVQR